MTVTIAQVGMAGIGSAVDRRLARLRPAEREAPRAAMVVTQSSRKSADRVTGRPPET
jgi:hypothetical protein